MVAELAVCATVVFMAEAPKEDAAEDQIGLIPIEQNIISYTNAERKRYGLPPLEPDDDLVKSARKHCAWMTRFRTLRHTWLPVAENIAMGQRSSRDVVRAWMSSSGHRANILNRSYRSIGVAAYRTESGTIFWCQQFRRQRPKKSGSDTATGDSAQPGGSSAEVADGGAGQGEAASPASAAGRQRSSGSRPTTAFRRPLRILRWRR